MMHLRDRWAIRIIIAICAPVPVGSAAVTLAHLLYLGLSIIHLPLFFLFTALMGYWLAGAQCILYAVLVELTGSCLPVVERNIILYTCFNAAALGLCTSMPFLVLGGGDPDGMFLSLGALGGAATALMLYPFTPRNSRAGGLRRFNPEQQGHT